MSGLITIPPPIQIRQELGSRYRLDPNEMNVIGPFGEIDTLHSLDAGNVGSLTCVAPSRARGLKRSLVGTQDRLNGVAPSRARGLKLFVPSRAIWIFVVAPSRARGLKPANSDVWRFSRKSRPHGRVD